MGWSHEQNRALMTHTHTKTTDIYLTNPGARLPIGEQIMNPTLRTETVLIEYWDCGQPEHRHKTEGVARACIEKQAKREIRGTRPRNWTAEDFNALLKQYRDGASMKDLARRLGLSREYTRTMVHKAERLESGGDLDSPFRCLSTRTRNCLMAEDLRTIDAVRSAYSDGGLQGIPNMGALSIQEVRLWLKEQEDNLSHEDK